MIVLSVVGEPSLTVLGIIALVVGGLLKIVNKILDEKFTMNKSLEKDLSNLTKVRNNQEGAIDTLNKMLIKINKIHELCLKNNDKINSIEEKAIF